MGHKHFLMVGINDGLLFLVLVKNAQAWQSENAELHWDQSVSQRVTRQGSWHQVDQRDELTSD
jgi:hypothetical protein